MNGSKFLLKNISNHRNINTVHVSDARDPQLLVEFKKLENYTMDDDPVRVTFIMSGDRLDVLIINGYIIIIVEYDYNNMSDIIGRLRSFEILYDIVYDKYYVNYINSNILVFGEGIFTTYIYKGEVNDLRNNKKITCLDISSYESDVQIDGNNIIDRHGKFIITNTEGSFNYDTIILIEFEKIITGGSDK